jgi:hypothetical protein
LIVGILTFFSFAFDTHVSQCVAVVGFDVLRFDLFHLGKDIEGGKLRVLFVFRE